jgi:hypothetical protein
LIAGDESKNNGRTSNKNMNKELGLGQGGRRGRFNL